MMDSLRIEAMTEESIDSVCAIENASFLNPWSKLCFLDELSFSDSHNFILKLENSFKTNQIIAYLCCRVIIDELHILKFAVHPEQRHKGIATDFLNHCLNAPGFKHIKTVMLDVRESNTAAIGLYKKLDFHIVGQRPNYYSDTGEDAFLMRKLIKGVIN
ncbi:MAG: ribosomal protein S18-alanine N-acetyltransferase [Desulfosalsimonadaceae bacterium]|nr:ribosomal protein S18-alanine N-acetyltransferase [Desulfosalsimonadaceae bacterium]